jgi:hypothetical protein
MEEVRMKYVVQADYENGETLFVAENGNPPALSVDEARVFLSKQAAKKVAEEKNNSIPRLVWEVAEY